MKFIKYALIVSVAFLTISCSDAGSYSWEKEGNISAYTPKVGK